MGDSFEGKANFFYSDDGKNFHKINPEPIKVSISFSAPDCEAEFDKLEIVPNER